MGQRRGVVIVALLSAGCFLVACGSPQPSPPNDTFAAPSVGSGSGAVVIGGVTGGQPGERASASVSAPPQTACVITVTAPDGKTVRAAGLEPKTTDAAGHASWLWQVAPGTATGIGMVDVACAGVHAAPVRLFIG
jgi:hypothetical protein